MTDDYNIIDAITKSHNNDKLYDILAKDLKMCKDTILKMVSSNICVKQDTKKNDTDNVNVCEKQDTNENDTDNVNVCEKQDTNKNEASINENDNDNDSEADDDNDSEADDDNDSKADDDDDNDSEADDSVNKDFPNLSDKTINNLIIDKIRKEILNNSEIRELISAAENIHRDDFLLKLDKYRKLNKLSDNLLDNIWKIAYGENKVNNEINSIDIDKKKMLRDIQINI